MQVSVSTNFWEITVQNHKEKTEAGNTHLGLVRVAIQNFLKNPVISMVLGLQATSFLA